MRHRIVSMCWTASLAIAVAATSFMVSTPAEAVRKCRSETKTTYKRVCTRTYVRGKHVTNRTWRRPEGAPTGGVSCRNVPVTKTVLICQQSPAVPRAPKPGRRPIRVK